MSLKNKSDFFAGTLVSFFLTISVLYCIISSFSIAVSPFVLVTSTLIFTAYFALLGCFVNSRKNLAVCYLVTSAVALFTVLFSFEIISSQTNYAVNCILKIYSEFLSCPSSVNFSSFNSKNADFLFAALSFLLCFVITDSVVRLRRIIPAAVISVVFLIPCFIIVNTLPALVPLLTVVSLLFALYITTNFRRKNPAQGGVILLSATAVMLAVSVLVSFIFPVKNYKRFEWQNNLLSLAQSIMGFEEKDTNSIANVGDSVDKIKDLSQVGSVSKTGEKVMRVRANTSGPMYLRGVAYANYSDNKWSMLTEEQEKLLPKDFNAFLMTKNTEGSTNFSVSFEKRQSLCYFPYYISRIPDGFDTVDDALIKNTKGLMSYSGKYVPYSGQEFFYTPETEAYSSYKKFVYDTYTDISESTKEKLLEILKDNGLDMQVNRLFSDKEMISPFYARRINQIVSSVGEYSLTVDKMPEGEDFPVWFLTKADKGYCVHYATTAALLLRAVGIPARYVTGYYFNAQMGDWTVVSSDNAHAWVEYFDDKVGWVPLEATPGSFAPEDYKPSENTQSSTKAENNQSVTTEPQTEYTTEKNTNNNSDKENKSFNLNLLLLFAVVIIPVSAVVLLVRRAVILKRRRKRFARGEANSRAVHIFRYIEHVGKYSKIIIPDEIRETAMKARFSTHTVSDEELSAMLSHSRTVSNELMENSSMLKRLYYKYIIVID